MGPTDSQLLRLQDAVEENGVYFKMLHNGEWAACAGKTQTRRWFTDMGFYRAKIMSDHE